MRTASCGPSASACTSALAIRTRSRTRTSRISYWSPLGSPLCACAPAGRQTSCRSVDDAFRAAWGHGGPRLQGGVFALAYASLRPLRRSLTPRAKDSFVLAFSRQAARLLLHSCARRGPWRCCSSTRLAAGVGSGSWVWQLVGGTAAGMSERLLVESRGGGAAERQSERGWRMGGSKETTRVV